MYGTIVSIELAAIALLLAMSGIAGGKASKLVFSGTEARLRSRSRKLLWWAGYVSAAVCVVIGSIVYMIVEMEPIFWVDRAALHIPLVALPALLVWFVSVPRLAGLQKDIARGSAEPVAAELRSRASKPEVAAPFQMLALGALTTLYFALVPPIPFEWLAVAVPVGIYSLLCIGLWRLHRRRSAKAGRPDTVLVLRSWQMRALRNIGVLLIAGVIASPFFIAAMNGSRLPAELDMGTGIADYGGGIVPAGGGHHDHTAHAAVQPASSAAPTVSVTELTGPQSGEPDRQFTLTAEKKTVRLSSGKEVDAWTYNG